MTDLAIMTRAGRKKNFTAATIDKFGTALRGKLVEPSHPTYDEVRKVFNAMHDCRPALIVMASDAADVSAAVQFAAEHDLLLAVRGGGHSAPGFGTCDDGVVIDLRQMKQVRVDPKRRTASAQGGCTWGDFNTATYPHGLATTGGIVSTTGIAGLTLGGGMGYLNRQCGLSCDNLVSAEVVLADGRAVVCSRDEEKDLFWAIRGGGGNFGVVTSFEYQLHEVKDVLVGITFFPPEGKVLRRYSEFILRAPEQLTALCAYTRAEPLPFVPVEWHLQPVSVVISCWTGEVKLGKELIAELGDWGRVVGELVEPMPYPEINKLFDEAYPAGLQNYWKGNFAHRLTDEAIELYAEYGNRVPNELSSVFFYPVDGACHRVGREETAFAFRDINFATFISGTWPEAADNARNIEWVRDCYEAVRPYSLEAGYINASSDHEQHQVQADYGKNYGHLTHLKARYDPDNLFRLNQNIRPAA